MPALNRVATTFQDRSTEFLAGTTPRRMLGTCSGCHIMTVAEGPKGGAMSRGNHVASVLAVLGILFMPAYAAAQGAVGTLLGNVKDKSGAADQPMSTSMPRS